MRFVNFVLVGFVLIGVSVLVKKSWACQSEDSRWIPVTQTLEAEAEAKRPVLPRLKKELPKLYQNMKADTARRDWLALWGRSINFDEFAKGVIVSPAIIDSFMDFFAPPTGPSVIIKDRQIVHAGVEHTYGYLFSNLQTPFGYKRARWIRPTIDHGFGFSEETISPLPMHGTLFSNVTYFTGRIAFRNEPELLKPLKNEAQRASPAVTRFKYNSLKPVRLEETIRTEQGEVILRTDLVPFLHPVEDDSNSFLLIYSIADHRKGSMGTKLISAFPVESSFVETALKEDGLGNDKPIITRYNAYVDGITGQSWTGTRKKL